MRYVHLNPVRAGIVEHPGACQWSSYRGYARDRGRLDWVAYDELLASWAGEYGGRGSEPAAAYRRYVTAELSQPLGSPWSEAYHGWILGSQEFIDRIKSIVSGQPRRDRPARVGCLRLPTRPTSKATTSAKNCRNSSGQRSF